MCVCVCVCVCIYIYICMYTISVFEGGNSLKTMENKYIYLGEKGKPKFRYIKQVYISHQ